MRIFTYWKMHHGPKEFPQNDPPEGYTGEPVMTVSEIIARVQRGQSVPLSYSSDEPQVFSTQLVDDFDVLDYRDQAINEVRQKRNGRGSDILNPDLAGTEAPMGNSVADKVGDSEISEKSGPDLAKS